jgi:hypothetical protein
MAKLHINKDNLVTIQDKFEQRRDAKVEAAKAYGYEVQQKGFPFDFGDGFGVLHLQLRDAQDQANWLVARQNMQDAVDAGYGDAPVAPIHTAENITVMVTPNNGINMLRALSAWAMELYKNSWELKEALRNTKNDHELDGIDIKGGWKKQ